METLYNNRSQFWILALLFMSTLGRPVIAQQSKPAITQKLLTAIKTNDLPKVQKLIENHRINPDTLLKDNKRQAPLLMFAAHYGGLAMVKYLISKGANYQKKGILVFGKKEDDWYGSLLTIAVGNGKFDLLKYLLEELKIPVNDRGMSIYRGLEYTALYVAIVRQNIKLARYLILLEADVNLLYGNNNLTVVVVACGKPGNYAILKLLLQNGAKQVPYGENKMPISIAARYGDVKMVKLLIKYGAETEVVTAEGLNLLHMAALGDHNAQMMKFLLQGLQLNPAIVTQSGMTPLMLAMRASKLTTVRLLIKKGANIKAQDKDEWTALHYAVRYSRHKLVQWFFDQGMKPKPLNDDGTTLAHVAAKYSDMAMVKTLRKNGVNLNQENFTGILPVYTALRSQKNKIARFLLNQGKISKAKLTECLYQVPVYGQADIIKLLVIKGAAIEGESWRDKTPLLRVAWDSRGKAANIKTLVNLGANVNARSRDDQSTPLLEVLDGGWPKLEIVRFLVNKGAKINVKDKSGNTPLLNAVLWADISIVRFLVNRGANIHVTDNQEHNALYYAFRKGKTKIVKFLIEKGAIRE